MANTPPPISFGARLPCGLKTWRPCLSSENVSWKWARAAPRSHLARRGAQGGGAGGGGRALRQHAVEGRVVRVRREVDPGVVVSVAVHHAGQGGERQVESIGRMREKQRIASGHLYRPEVVEFDEEPILVERRGADNLAGGMEADWRALERHASGRREVVVPGEFATLDPYVTNQRDQESGGHGVYERGAPLDCVVLNGNSRVERLSRHGLEPVGQAARRRDG